MFAIVTAATLFWSLYAGTIIDRYPRKNIFIGLNIAGFVTMTTIASIGFVLGQAPDLLIMLSFGVTIFIFNIHYPSLYAFGQEITERKHYGRINSLFEVIGQSTAVLAGGAAAFLLGGTKGDFPLKAIIDIDIEAWSMHEILALDACTYGLAVLLIAFIKYTPIVERSPDTSPLFERLKAGFRFLKNNASLFWFGIASYAIFIALLVQAFYLMMMYVSNHLEESAFVFAVGEMLYAVGALLAGVFIRKIFRSLHEVKAILILIVITIGIFMMMAFTKLPAVFLAFNFILGLTNAGTRILRITYLFNHIDNDMIGRANSIFNALNIGTRVLFLSLFSITFFTEGSNVTYGYLILGMFLMLALAPILVHYKRLTAKKADDKD